MYIYIYIICCGRVAGRCILYDSMFRRLPGRYILYDSLFRRVPGRYILYDSLFRRVAGRCIYCMILCLGGWQEGAYIV